MGLLLDSSVCISVLRGGSRRTIDRLRALDPADLAICSVVLGELLVGAEKSSSPEFHRNRIEEWLGQLPVWPYDEVAAKRHAVLRAELERAGRMIGNSDLMIAAIAVERGAAVATCNVREFRTVSGLVVQHWAR